jgi:hypothetical protein
MAGKRHHCLNCGTPLPYPGLCGPCKRATDKLLSIINKKKGGRK